MNNKTISGMKCILYVVGTLALSLSAQAASFDCGKAATQAEKLICRDTELSKLDEELNEAYKTALQSGMEAEAIKKAQKQWMKKRNECADADCVKHAYEERLKELSRAATGSNQPVNNIDEKVANTHPYILVMSKDKELCESMLDLYNNDVNTHGRIDYGSHDIFSRIDWVNIDVLNENSSADVERAVFDINNDGRNELVIKTRMQVFNSLNDSLYIFPADSDVLVKLKPGQGGLEALSLTSNFLFGNDTNTSYYLKNVPKLLQEKILAYKLKHLPNHLKKVNINDLRRDLGKITIGPFYDLEPFIWHETTYISMTDRNPEWIVVGKYRQAEEVQDICYFYDLTHRFIQY